MFFFIIFNKILFIKNKIIFIKKRIKVKNKFFLMLKNNQIRFFILLILFFIVECKLKKIKNNLN